MGKKKKEKRRRVRENKRKRKSEKRRIRKRIQKRRRTESEEAKKRRAEGEIKIKRKSGKKNPPAVTKAAVALKGMVAQLQKRQRGGGRCSRLTSVCAKSVTRDVWLP